MLATAFSSTFADGIAVLRPPVVPVTGTITEGPRYTASMVLEGRDAVMSIIDAFTSDMETINQFTASVERSNDFIAGMIENGMTGTIT